MMTPDKIYIHEASAPEMTDKLPYHIEYIRKNAFIEKAADYLNYILYDRVEIKNPGKIIPSLCAKGEFIEDFKNYMKDSL